MDYDAGNREYTSAGAMALQTGSFKTQKMLQCLQVVQTGKVTSNIALGTVRITLG